MQTGGIILCGGHSTRMGLPKATLPFGPEPMVARVARLLGQAVPRLVVVAAPGQELPPLQAGIVVTRDRREGRGPLEALAAGLAAAQDAGIDAAYVTSCDVPLLVPGFVTRVFDLLGQHEIAVPREGEFHHPLAAVYCVSVLGVVERLLAEDRMRPFFLFQECNTREVAPAEWHDVDPSSATLKNLNRPEDYLSALAAAGFEAPEEIVRQLR
jgi:molybdopterin-guanine dinucleotide biosynthesis protein A